MTGQLRRARLLPPQHVDARGCAAFRWTLTSSAFTEAVVCRLPPAIRTYVVHADGRIVKRTPTSITRGYENVIAYVYVEASGRRHDLGTYTFRQVQRYAPGNVEIEGHSWIIDLRTVAATWSSGNLQYGFALHTTRPFIGDVALASLFGAMLEVGYTDIVCTGFSTDEGRTAEPSRSHVNGTNGDFRYLRNDALVGPLHLAFALGRPELLDETRQEAFIAALARFGWRTAFSHRYVRNGEVRLLAGTRHLESHHHHLHIQGFAPNVENVDE